MNFRKYTCLVLLTTLTCLLLSACTQFDPEANHRSRLFDKEIEPDTRGEITRITIRDNKVAAIHVKGYLLTEEMEGEAVVSITPETAIFQVENEGTSPVSADKLSIGQFVEILNIPGTTKERYPPISKAQEILILPLGGEQK